MPGTNLKVKKGDNVMIQKGKDAGKSGKILRVMPNEGRVVVEGLNLTKKNLRPQKQGEKGQIVEIASPVRVDNVALVCSSCKKPSKVGFRVKGDKKERYCKKCEAKI